MPDCARVAASRGLPVVIVPHWDDPWPPMDSPAESQAVFSCFQFCLWWPSLVSPLLELPNSFHLVSQLFYHLISPHVFPHSIHFYPMDSHYIPTSRPWGPWRQWPRPHLNAPPVWGRPLWDASPTPPAMCTPRDGWFRCATGGAPETQLRWSIWASAGRLIV